MNFSKIFTKKEVYIGGISKSIIDSVKSEYKIKPRFNYDKFKNNDIRLNTNNILEYLRKGIDLNHVFKYDAIPIYMRCEDKDTLEICKYFGINKELSIYKPITFDCFTSYSVKSVPFKMYSEYRDFLSNFEFKDFYFLNRVEEIEWLKNMGKSFNPRYDEGGIINPLVWDVLIDFNEEGNLLGDEAASLILNKTDFNFSFEFLYLDNDTNQISKYKTWYYYLDQCAYWSDFKHNDASIDVRYFIEYYKYIINFKETTSDGDNIYIILMDNNYNFNLLTFSVLFSYGISPFLKNMYDVSFYDYCIKNYEKYGDIIKVIEDSDLFKESEYYCKDTTIILEANEEKEEYIESKFDTKIESYSVSSFSMNLSINPKIYENTIRMDIPEQISNSLYFSKRKNEVRDLALKRSKDFKWIDQVKLKELIETYNISQNCYYSEFSEINRNNILSFIELGGDFNDSRFMLNYLKSSDEELIDICIIFGADLHLLIKYISWKFIDEIHVDYWNIIKPVILKKYVYEFEFIKLQHAMWLNENNFSFVPISNNDDDSTNEIPYYNALVSFEANEFKDVETANYILNETNFSFDYEYIYFNNESSGDRVVKVWYVYLLNLYKKSSSKTERLKDLRKFFNFYKNTIDFNEINSNGDNVYSILRMFNISQQIEIIKLFLEFRINPYVKNNKGISFYDSCLSKSKTMAEAIRLIEEYKETLFD